MRLQKSLVANLFLASSVAAGPVVYAVCQAGCSSLAVACYSAAGFTLGIIATTAAPAAVIACKTAYGTCQAACAAAALAATP
ncbi:hypothetical protein F5883DRAFT_437093 [Diaporthe sp. PMI_573]|nr:hypothetical protein F5883DRAFT_437093 [Diaporthaceae sp. PMI_573]